MRGRAVNPECPFAAGAGQARRGTTSRTARGGGDLPRTQDARRQPAAYSRATANCREGASMGAVNLKQYQDNLNRVLSRWSARVGECRVKIAKINKQIDTLEKQLECATPEGEKKFAAEIEQWRKAREKVYQEIMAADLSCRTELMLLPPLEPMTKSNEKEYIKLPAFIEKLIAEEGVPLGKLGLVMKPDIDFDFKKGKLEKFAIELKVKWK
jgi:hypothetical protein